MKLKTTLAGENFAFEKPEDLAVAVSGRLKIVGEELKVKQKALEEQMKDKKKVVENLKQKTKIFNVFLKQYKSTE